MEELNKVYNKSKNIKDIYAYLINQSAPEYIAPKRFHIPSREGCFIVGYVFNESINKISLILSKKEDREIKKALYLELGLNERKFFDILVEEILKSKDSREMRQKFDEKLNPLGELDNLYKN